MLCFEKKSCTFAVRIEIIEKKYHISAAIKRILLRYLLKENEWQLN